MRGLKIYEIDSRYIKFLSGFQEHIFWLCQDSFAKLLDKWQVAQKYREMIESIYVEEINGMNKHYTITLKEGFINDETGSRNQTEK